MNMNKTVLLVTAVLVISTSLYAFEKKSGFEFLSPESQEIQDDEFLNGGYELVEQGHELFNQPGKNGKSCASCHGEDGGKLSAKKIATYPVYDETLKKPLTLQGRIHQCSENRLGNEKMKYDEKGGPAIALETFVRNLAKGEKVNVSIDGPIRPFYEAGKKAYYSRSGQLDMQCSHCHDTYTGFKLRAQTLSQGHPNGYPAFRLKNRRVNGLHERFRQCENLLRAQYAAPGSDRYVNLELFLYHRSNGLTIETPGVRF